MAKKNWVNKLKTQKTATEETSGEGTVTPATPPTKRTAQPETAPAVDETAERTKRISARLQEPHHAMFTKIIYAKAMNTGRRPLPCEVLEDAIEALGKDYGFEIQ